MSLNPRTWFSRETLGKDISAGVVLGIESVPDGLASGLLAGVNPLAGLYGYLFGMVGAATCVQRRTRVDTRAVLKLDFGTPKS